MNTEHIGVNQSTSSIAEVNNGLLDHVIYEKLSVVKRLNSEDREEKLEIISDQGIKEITDITYGHRTRAKCLTVEDEGGQSVQHWFPQVEVNGYFVFIQDKESAGGVVECTSRYLALKYARRYLAKKHKRVEMK